MPPVGDRRKTGGAAERPAGGPGELRGSDGLRRAKIRARKDFSCFFEQLFFPVHMSNLNRVMLIGNLTRTPELRTVANGSHVIELGLAVNRNWTEADGQKREEVTFLDITFWGRTAENAARFLSKGRSVFVEGRLQLDTWQDAQSGQERTKLRIIGERLQFLGGAAAASEAAPDGPHASSSPDTPPPAGPPSPPRGRYQPRRAA